MQVNIMKSYKAGDIVSFTAEKECTYYGQRYLKGDIIKIVLNQDWSEEEGLGEGGFWGSEALQLIKAGYIKKEVIS